MVRRCKVIPPSPCKAKALLEWLGEHTQELFIREWCEALAVPEADKEQMITRYGERLIGLTTFVNFWVYRDLPPAKRHCGTARPLPEKTVGWMIQTVKRGFIPSL